MKKNTVTGKQQVFQYDRNKMGGILVGNKVGEIERGHSIKDLVCNTNIFFYFIPK